MKQILKNIDKKKRKKKITDPGARMEITILKDNIKQCGNNMEVSGTQFLSMVISYRLGYPKLYQQRFREMKKGGSEADLWIKIQR